MYKFYDTTTLSGITAPIRFVYDGKDLTQAMNTSEGSFYLLAVHGRGLVASSPDLIDVDGRDGKHPYGNNLKPRELLLDVFMSGTNARSLRLQYEKLNNLLRANVAGKPRSMFFSDESDRLYYGYLTEVEEQAEVSNHRLIRLRFLCPDPYKYSAEKTVQVNGDRVDFQTKGIKGYEMTMILTPRVATNRLAITSFGGGSIELTSGGFTTSDKIMIDGQRSEVFFTGNPPGGTKWYRDMAIDKFQSSFPKTLTLGDPGMTSVTFNVSVTGEIRYREVYL